EFASPLPVHPLHDRSHAGARDGGDVEEWREALLGGYRPEVASLDATLVEFGGAGQPPGHLERAVPSVRSMKRRPGVPREARELERIEHEDITKRAATARRCREKVGLDRGGDRRAAPFEQRRHGQARRLARLRRAERDQGVPLLGTDQPTRTAPQREPLVTESARGR